MSVFFNVQHGIAGLMISLAGERKTARIQNKYSVNLFQHRTMDMSETYTVAVSGLCFIYDSGKVHRYSIIMPVTDKDPMSGNGEFIFSGKVREKVVISGDHGAGTFSQCLNIKFPAFYVSTVDQHVKGLFLQNCLFQISVTTVRVTDYKDFHLSSSLMARRAFPLWLILFFSSMEISAEEQPYSGR